MQRIGMYMVLAAVFSVIWHMMGRELRLLMWINNWGETVAWVIRIGFGVVGAGLWLGGRQRDESVTGSVDDGFGGGPS